MGPCERRSLSVSVSIGKAARNPVSTAHSASVMRRRRSACNNMFAVSTCHSVGTTAFRCRIASSNADAQGTPFVAKAPCRGDRGIQVRSVRSPFPASVAKSLPIDVQGVTRGELLQAMIAASMAPRSRASVEGISWATGLPWRVMTKLSPRSARSSSAARWVFACEGADRLHKPVSNQLAPLGS